MCLIDCDKTQQGVQEILSEAIHAVSIISTKPVLRPYRLELEEKIRNANSSLYDCLLIRRSGPHGKKCIWWIGNIGQNIITEISVLLLHICKKQ
jgi:hypothetical protein